MESLTLENDKIIESIVSEIINYEGQIKKIKSKISNFVRYDIIGKNDSVTYQIPEVINSDIKDIFSS